MGFHSPLTACLANRRGSIDGNCPAYGFPEIGDLLEDPINVGSLGLIFELGEFIFEFDSEDFLVFFQRFLVVEYVKDFPADPTANEVDANSPLQIGDIAREGFTELVKTL